MFLEPAELITFILASVAVAIVPGPTVTVIIANSVQRGTRAGLLNIAGTQLGVFLLLVVLALGLEAVTTTLAWLFDWLRLVGAAYLIWLGIKLLRSNGELGGTVASPRGDRSYFLQGLLVVLSNPKLLLFFGAFLPQFIDRSGNAAFQTLVLGLIFMFVATFLDSLYALAAGRAGAVLTKRNVRTVEITGGSVMIGGGLWLALTRGS